MHRSDSSHPLLRSTLSPRLSFDGPRRPSINQASVSSKSPFYSSRYMKTSPFARNMPSNLASTATRRLASLPEEPTNIDSEHPNRRVVSMPDNYYPSLAVIDRSIVSSDSSYSSLDEIHIQDYYTPGFRFAPGTPSPSSSPDSIAIVGPDNTNSISIPPLFTRDTRLTQEDTEQGWVCWPPGSSPKPIPALHGPLSLPYARCPSGAEGSVAEGNNLNLTHMIWGLEKQKISESAPPEPLSRPEIYPYPQQSCNVLDIAHPVFPAARHPMEPPLVLPPPRNLLIGTGYELSHNAPISLESLVIKKEPSRNDLGMEETIHTALGYPWLDATCNNDKQVQPKRPYFEQRMPHPDTTLNDTLQKVPFKYIGPLKRLSALEIAQQYREGQARKFQEVLYHSSPFPSNQSTPFLPTSQGPHFPNIEQNDHLIPFSGDPLQGQYFNPVEKRYQPFLDDSERETSPIELAPSKSHSGIVARPRNQGNHGYKSNTVAAPPTPEDSEFESLNFRSRQSKGSRRPSLPSVLEEPSNSSNPHTGSLSPVGNGSRKQESSRGHVNSNKHRREHSAPGRHKAIPRRGANRHRTSPQRPQPLKDSSNS